MRSLLFFSVATVGALGFTGLATVPAAAQSADRIIDIYGTDKCPSSGGQDIVVCRKHPETERYRIPQNLREQAPSPQAAGNTGLAAMNSTGATGVQVNSCSTIGAGVAAGCLKQEADAWKADQNAQKKDAAGIP